MPQSNLKPYIDQSGDEISIHALTAHHKELLCDAVILLFNNMPKNNEKVAETKKKLIELKKILE